MSDERHGEKRSVEAVVGKDDASTEGSSSNKRRKLWSSSVTIDKSIEQMSAVQKVVDDLLLSPVPALHKDNVIYQDRKEFEHQKKKKGFIPALCSLLRTSPEFRFRPRANSNTLGDFGITQVGALLSTTPTRTRSLATDARGKTASTTIGGCRFRSCQ
jgi:hypothetical protein